MLCKTKIHYQDGGTEPKSCLKQAEVRMVSVCDHAHVTDIEVCADHAQEFANYPRLYCTRCETPWPQDTWPGHACQNSLDFREL